MPYSERKASEAMNLQDYKQDYLNNHAQFIAFSEGGEVLDSCHTLIDVSEKGLNMFGLFPVLENVMSSLRRLTTLDRELVYPVIEHHVGDRLFIFDLIFRKLEKEGDEFFYMLIIDSTPQYHSIMQLKKRLTDQMGLADSDGDESLRVIR